MQDTKLFINKGTWPKCLEATGLYTGSFLTHCWAPPLIVLTSPQVGTGLCESQARTVTSLWETPGDIPKPLTDSVFYLLTEFYRAGFCLILPHPSLLLSSLSAQFTPSLSFFTLTYQKVTWLTRCPSTLPSIALSAWALWALSWDLWW